ncbi:hypothetical protein RR42_m0841 [Cupriavidus basilensis]|uniref:Uncharacterized protein n=1 Tax=Cupriavidus basilensis TaxID=68895 RepID=A0A0C4Y5T9_9BURK|nr:hypothetical protein RR42_m0841 [Cupriavidus basilensis]
MDHQTNVSGADRHTAPVMLPAALSPAAQSSTSPTSTAA